MTDKEQLSEAEDLIVVLREEIRSLNTEIRTQNGDIRELRAEVIELKDVIYDLREKQEQILGVLQTMHNSVSKFTERKQ